MLNSDFPAAFIHCKGIALPGRGNLLPLLPGEQARGNYQEYDEE